MTNGHPSSLKTAETTRRASTSCGLSATDVRLEILLVDELSRFDFSFSALEEELRVDQQRVRHACFALFERSFHAAWPEHPEQRDRPVDRRKPAKTRGASRG